ncbi:hypothetical protein [Amycolatopsis sp. NPDC051102]|uniref:hypothetical protein n=1 Tax=Amycolatopsis sp. NPDC051102 TaxID=3155163 RepID=UPI00341B7EBB
MPPNTSMRAAAIAHHLFFGEFIDYLTKTAATKPAPFSRDAVLGHHERARGAFSRCYRRFVEENAVTVVIPLDTVEVVRNTFFLTQLHRWMRELPATLVVLSGRPAADRSDAIKEIFADNESKLRTVTVTVTGFTDAEAGRFLTDSDISPDLSPALIQALVSLTNGHPLWLELAVDYLRKFDLPPELEEPSPHDDELRDRFRRRMVTPFRSADFWPEAIKRLAVVRHSVDEDIWRAIMADRALPPEYRGDWGLAWETLRTQPWVRRVPTDAT